MDGTINDVKGTVDDVKGTVDHIDLRTGYLVEVSKAKKANNTVTNRSTTKSAKTKRRLISTVQ